MGYNIITIIIVSNLLFENEEHLFCFSSHCSFQYVSVLLLEPISHNMINLLKRNTSETIIACQIVFHCYHANSL